MCSLCHSVCGLNFFSPPPCLLLQCRSGFLLSQCGHCPWPLIPSHPVPTENRFAVSTPLSLFLFISPLACCFQTAFQPAGTLPGLTHSESSRVGGTGVSQTQLRSTTSREDSSQVTMCFMELCNYKFRFTRYSLHLSNLPFINKLSDHKCSWDTHTHTHTISFHCLHFSSPIEFLTDLLKPVSLLRT